MQSHFWYPCKSNPLPSPGHLDEAWLERLGAPGWLARHYQHLSPPELLMINAELACIEYYRDHNLLHPGANYINLFHRKANEMDNHWLIEGKGRGVDYRRALYVVEAYAQYCNWAKAAIEEYNRKDGFCVLDIVWPYYLDPRKSRFSGGGFFRLQVIGRDLYLGQIGETKWNRTSVVISELALTEIPDDWTEFKKTPFLYLNPRLSLREFSRPSELGGDNPVFHVGMLGHMCQRLRPQLEGKTRLSVFRQDLSPFGERIIKTDETYRLKLRFPISDSTQRETRGLLQLIADHHHSHRLPREPWKFEFDVSSNLLTTSVKILASDGIPYTDGIKPILYRDLLQERREQADPDAIDHARQWRSYNWPNRP
ncbi:MAG: hypothetical protein V1838_03315 [Patescibacteria group bacterium]